jgi:hypothetical protein
MNRPGLFHKNLGNYLTLLSPSLLYQFQFNPTTNQLYGYVLRNKIYFFLLILKLHFNCQFKTLTELTASDYPEYKQRFNLWYI